MAPVSLKNISTVGKGEKLRNVLREEVYNGYKNANGASIRKRQQLMQYRCSSRWREKIVPGASQAERRTGSSMNFGKHRLRKHRVKSNGNSLHLRSSPEKCSHLSSSRKYEKFKQKYEIFAQSKKIKTLIHGDGSINTANHKTSIAVEIPLAENIKVNAKRDEVGIGNGIATKDDIGVKKTREVKKKYSQSSSNHPILPAIITKKSPRLERVETLPPAVLPAINIFKRKVAHKRKQGKYLAKFRRYARFFLLLIRLWKIHALRVHDVIQSFSSLNIMADGESNSSGTGNSILFDKRYFRADTQARLSRATKRILQKKPSQRTEKEIHLVRVALGSYKSLAEYPIHIQNKIASKAWYECYNSKRVITREGHVPMGYYFILSGSAIVSAMDRDRNVRKTLTILTRGDSFGESAIVSKIRRITTVISKDRLELLVLSSKDYVHIFMSGGLQDPTDSFLKNVKFLESWPIEILSSNPSKAMFSFFKRSSVLVSDSRQSEWLYIVKSGSVSVLKRLHNVIPGIHKKPKLLGSVPGKPDPTTHEKELQKRLDRHLSKLNEGDNYRIRHNTLPPINIATTDEYVNLKNNMHNNNSVRRTSLVPSTIPSKWESHGDPSTEHHSARRRFDGMIHTKGPFLVTLPERKEDGDSASSNVGVKTRRTTAIERTSSNEQGQENANDSSTDIFVTVQVLTKGNVFVRYYNAADFARLNVVSSTTELKGMEELVYGRQPSFSLVSNGAECLMINKKFYMEHINDTLMARMREEVHPFPSDEELQLSLSKQVNWNAYRVRAVNDVIHQSKLRKLHLIDAKTRIEEGLQA